nr:TetR/AcrR family transcriptional regulator [Pseudonocardia acidicola]
MRADAARNHERLVRAARAVFQESGTAAAPLEEVARRAGVGVATLYRRFAGRDELVAAVFEQYFAEEIEPLAERAARAADPWAGLVEMLDAAVATVAAHRAILGAAKDAGAITAGTVGRFLGPLADVLDRAQATGVVRADLELRDLSAVVLMVVSTLGPPGLADPCAAGPGSPAELAARRRRYLGLVLDGLRPPSGARSSAGLTSPQL